uniref:Reverse transcriptase domain-containing protein n=1 Tax=Scylla olivacea TaxID=85551 RepID=A0A0P4WNB5_SCYOL
MSLLSVMGKVFEKLVASVTWQHLDEHQLLSLHHFGFRSGRSTSDLLLFLSQEWQDTLDEGLDTLVVALDIAGAYDRVWHSGLLAKLQAKGIEGSPLMLLEDYLQGRTLRVVVNGRTSSPAHIGASVPQGSVVGPVLWNVYIDDLLRQLPAVKAYADDCTISLSYCRQDNQRAVANINRQLRYQRSGRRCGKSPSLRTRDGHLTVPCRFTGRGRTATV